MNEYNTKITYYYLDNLNIKKTLKAHSKYYSAKYGRLTLITIRSIFNERFPRPLVQP